MAPARAARAARSETVRPLRERGSELRPRLRLVRPGRNRLKIRLTPRAGVTLTILLFVALFGVAVSHALLIESQSRLDRLDSQVAEEQSRYERLRLDVAELESPDRVLAAAAELGMVVPDEVVWLTPDEAAAGEAGGEATTGGGEGSDDGEAADTAEENDTDTSWTEVKPYLGSTP
jgi:cell division protein FtsL